jgi:hypothetical protein
VKTATARAEAQGLQEIQRIISGFRQSGDGVVLTIARFARFRLKIKLVQAAVLVKGKGAQKQVTVKVKRKAYSLPIPLPQP